MTKKDWKKRRGQQRLIAAYWNLLGCGRELGFAKEPVPQNSLVRVNHCGLLEVVGSCEESVEGPSGGSK